MFQKQYYLNTNPMMFVGKKIASKKLIESPLIFFRKTDSYYNVPMTTLHYIFCMQFLNHQVFYTLFPNLNLENHLSVSRYRVQCTRCILKSTVQYNFFNKRVMIIYINNKCIVFGSSYKCLLILTVQVEHDFIANEKNE